MEFNCLIDDARPNWDYELLGKAILIHMFMTLKLPFS